MSILLYFLHSGIVGRCITPGINQTFMSFSAISLTIFCSPMRTGISFISSSLTSVISKRSFSVSSFICLSGTPYPEGPIINSALKSSIALTILLGSSATTSLGKLRSSFIFPFSRPIMSKLFVPGSTPITLIFSPREKNKRVLKRKRSLFIFNIVSSLNLNELVNFSFLYFKPWFFEFEGLVALHIHKLNFSGG